MWSEREGEGVVVASGWRIGGEGLVDIGGFIIFFLLEI